MKIDLALRQIERGLDRIYPPFRSKLFPGYKRVFKKNDTSMYRPPIVGKKIVAAWGDVVAASSFLNNRVIYLYPNFRNIFRVYRIKLHKRNFPELIEGSNIQLCLIIPYIRQVSKDRPVPSWRLVVITDKCQVYHNFPDRELEYAGEEHYRDIVKFTESAVWDLPGNQYPSKKMNCDESEYYFPLLPDAVYEYHPRIKDETTDKYGGRAFGKATYYYENGLKRKLSRFYFPLRNARSNSFCFMGGYEPNYKMTLIGTYCSNTDVGTRTVIFATSNGGREFFAQYEFNDDGTKENYGNRLGWSDIGSICTDEMYIQKRNLTFDDRKKWSFEEKIRVTEIDTKEALCLSLESTDSINSGNIIKLTGIPKGEYAFLFEKLYKIKKIDERRIQLFELASKSSTNLPCRHIHCINRIKDGWLIGTGETYPEGWLLLCQMKAADNWTMVEASNRLRFIQLNYSQSSVQRITGSVLWDDIDNTLLVASDSAFVNRPCFYKDLAHSSLGIYQGKLDDIDDFAKFKCICELSEPCYFFKEINGTLIAVTQRGEIAISFDKGVSWIRNRIGAPLYAFNGMTPEFVVINGWILSLNR